MTRLLSYIPDLSLVILVSVLNLVQLSASVDGHVVSDSSKIEYPYLGLRAGVIVSQGGFSMSSSYISQSSDLIGLGGGVDYSRYSNFLPYSILSPFAAYRVIHKSSRWWYYSEARLGFGVPVSKWDKGAFESSGGVFGGLRMGLILGKETPLLDLAIGYKFQKAQFMYDTVTSTVFEDIHFNRIELTIGFQI